MSPLRIGGGVGLSGGGSAPLDDEVYGAGWNGSLEAPTKNAVYDKIESVVGASGITAEEARDTIGAALVAGNNIDITVDDGLDTITIAVETLTLADVSDVTASAAEVNTLDGITSSTAELNILDGATLTVAELNHVDGVTSAIQTQLDARQPLDSDLTTIAGLTATTNNFMVANASAWASRTPAQAIAHLGLDVDIATLALPASTTISTFGASIIDDANEATFKATVNLEIGTDVQAFHARLAEIAGLADPNEDRMLVWDDSADDLILARAVKVVTVMIGDGTNVVPTGIWAEVRMPTSGVITKNSLLATKPGGNVSMVVDLWKDTYANYPPTVADTITASAKPTLSAAAKSEDSTLTGWTTTFAAGDIIRVNVDSASTVTLAALSIEFRETY